jgi:hypothetical protein
METIAKLACDPQRLSNEAGEWVEGATLPYEEAFKREWRGITTSVVA